jgi:two-component system cell cycle response regulator
VVAVDADLLDADEGDEESTAVIHIGPGAARISEPVASVPRFLLVQVHGGQLGQVIGLHGAEMTVGRHPGCEVWVSDTGVSRRHAKFLWAGDGYVLEDLGSANGTYVSGKRIDHHVLVDGEVVQFGGEISYRYSVTDSKQEAMLLHLYEASVSDPLTGIYKRDHFDSRLVSEISFALRHGSELSMLLFDIDHFKKVNDGYGHPAGDAILQQLTAFIQPRLRTEDIFARYGGEEFVIVLRSSAIEQAASVAERLRQAIEQHGFDHGGLRIPITVSIGVAGLNDCDETAESPSLLAVADRRLYAAKRSGRNRVVWVG